jgi:leader peptidase (prepilin peptidase)/N-methyltransferase
MRLSWQYPCIEALNGVLYVWFFVLYGGSYTALIYGLVASVLIIIALVDWRTYEIPIGCNIAIGVLALLYLVTMILLPLRDTPFEAATMISQLTTHIAGFFAVSGLFWLIYVLSRGRAIGGGDVKLMAVAGLLLGWQLILLALMVAAVTGSVVHLLLMRLKGKDRVLAFGPYLAFGILVAMLGGEVILSWYIGGWG